MQRDSDRGKFPTAIIAIVAAVIAVAVILITVFTYLSSTNPNYGYGGYGGYGGMMGGFGGISMLFIMPIGLIILVIVGYAIWRGFGWGGDHYGHYSSSGERENAMEILRQRYAKGEISKDQYEQMKRDIIA
jgi:putative membrane protein